MASEPDEPRQPARTTLVLGEDVARLSLGEIDERIRQLRAEIERLSDARTRKATHRSAVDGLFKR